MDAYTGEIRMFAGDYASPDWAKCNGQLMRVDSFRPLYSVIRNIYGGTPGVTFNLPSLQGIVPIGAGQGGGLSTNYALGSTGDQFKMTEVPEHDHPMYGMSVPAAAASPEGMMLSNLNRKSKYSDAATDSTLNLETIKDDAKDVTPISNEQPFLTIGYFICVNGH